MDNDREKKVAIYIRVSTTYQVDKDSLPMQRKDLTAYSSLVLGTENYEIFEDAGYSGKNTDRPSFQTMMSRIRKGEFTHVLVWKIDRISRNLLDFAEMFKELQKLRVTFVSKNEQFDTSSAMGEAMLKIILVFAELERNMTAERVTATMISRASSGIWNGGRIPYGYSYDKEKNVFSIREDEAAVCRLIRDNYLKTQSLLQTARIINQMGYKTRSGAEWSGTTVWKICESPFYAGVYRYNRCKVDGTSRILKPEDEWVLVADHHQAIFTLDEHNAMTALRDRNARSLHMIGRSHYGEHIHLFKGMVYCGKCGSKMNAIPSRKLVSGIRTTSFQCPVRRRSKDCDNPAINDMILGEFVINYVLNMLKAKTSFSSIQTPEELQKRLLRGSTFNAVAAVGSDGLNDFFNLLARYKSDSSYTLSFGRPKKKHAEVDPQVDTLRKERDKQERALKRLQNLYLYSDSSMPEKDFIIKKEEITSRIDEINKQLGMVADSGSITLSDEDFVKQASHLLISSYLQNKEYIYFEKLVSDVSPEVLQEYLATIIDSIIALDGRVASITFKNGLTHKFEYQKVRPNPRHI